MFSAFSAMNGVHAQGPAARQDRAVAFHGTGFADITPSPLTETRDMPFFGRTAAPAPELQRNLPPQQREEDDDVAHQHIRRAVLMRQVAEAANVRRRIGARGQQLLCDRLSQGSDSAPPSRTSSGSSLRPSSGPRPPGASTAAAVLQGRTSSGLGDDELGATHVDSGDEEDDGEHHGARDRVEPASAARAEALRSFRRAAASPMGEAHSTGRSLDTLPPSPPPLRLLMSSEDSSQVCSLIRRPS